LNSTVFPSCVKTSPDPTINSENFDVLCGAVSTARGVLFPGFFVVGETIGVVLELTVLCGEVPQAERQATQAIDEIRSIVGRV